MVAEYDYSPQCSQSLLGKGSYLLYLINWKLAMTVSTTVPMIAAAFYFQNHILQINIIHKTEIVTDQIQSKLKVENEK